MTLVTDIRELEELYGVPSEASLIKVSDQVTKNYQSLIEASPFMVLATSGPEGMDCSPRGDAKQVVFIQDRKTLLLPDRRGNNRMDSLRNIVRNPEIALLFLIPGSNTTLRLNGTATISTAPELTSQYKMQGKDPRSVIIVTIREIYFQCARAVMRADLWNPENFKPANTLPSAGDLMQELKDDFDGTSYDKEWPARAKETMW
ncbi:MAG: pyridoxamine 5'-phosphate oxidase family protein [Alphaproteobacteria bacterium]